MVCGWGCTALEYIYYYSSEKKATKVKSWYLANFWATNFKLLDTLPVTKLHHHFQTGHFFQLSNTFPYMFTLFIDNHTLTIIHRLTPLTYACITTPFCPSTSKHVHLIQTLNFFWHPSHITSATNYTNTPMLTFNCTHTLSLEKETNFLLSLPLTFLLE